MTTLRFVDVPGTAPGGHYSQAVVAGDFVFAAGQIAVDGEGQVVGETAYEQTLKTLGNLARALHAAGSSLSKVTKTTCFLVDIGDFTEFNRAYAEVFGDHRPARSTVAVKELVKGALVEVECVAMRG